MYRLSPVLLLGRTAIFTRRCFMCILPASVSDKDSILYLYLDAVELIDFFTKEENR
jgi:hypothetical protein